MLCIDASKRFEPTCGLEVSVICIDCVLLIFIASCSRTMRKIQPITCISIDQCAIVSLMVRQSVGDDRSIVIYFPQTMKLTQNWSDVSVSSTIQSDSRCTRQIVSLAHCPMFL